MALYGPAEKRLLAPGLNHSSGGMGAVRGVILHVIVGSLMAADSVFHNPSHKASAHFGVDFDGRVVQWVDTSDKAWAEGAGNPSWISVETAGRPEQPLTPAQVSAVAAILRWAQGLYHFPIQITDSPNTSGLGTHQMGGGAWGGHACPGPIRAAQRTDIVRLAQGAPAPVPQPIPSPTPKRKTMHVAYSPEDSTNARWLCEGKRVRWWIQTAGGLAAYQKVYGPEVAIPIKDLAAVPIEGAHP